MMLVEETSVPDAALPVEALKRHLRLGSGFAEDDMQDDLLASFLRAAMLAIEARTGKALLQRQFLMTLETWDSPDRQTLPIAPVVAVAQVGLIWPILPQTNMADQTVLDGPGVTQVLNLANFRVTVENQVSVLRPIQGSFPTIAADGSAAIRFTAGMASEFAALPSDLAQAVLMLASHFDEYRNEYGLSQGCMPFGVSSLIARYCPMRMGFSR